MKFEITKFAVAELFGLEFTAQKYGKDKYDEYNTTYHFTFHDHDIVIQANYEINDQYKAGEEAADIVLKAIGQDSVRDRKRF